MKIGSDDGSPGVGHNSDTILNQTAQGQLKSIIQRIERLETEKAEIAAHIREVKAEAKGNGFDTKIINKVLAKRKIDRARGQEAYAILVLYCDAIGEPELAELI